MACKPPIAIDFTPRLQSFAGQTGGTRAVLKDRGYLIVGALIALAIAADVAWNQGHALVFVVRELQLLMDYVIFWR